MGRVTPTLSTPMNGASGCLNSSPGVSALGRSGVFQYPTASDQTRPDTAQLAGISPEILAANTSLGMAPEQVTRIEEKVRAMREETRPGQSVRLRHIALVEEHSASLRAGGLAFYGVGSKNGQVLDRAVFSTMRLEKPILDKSGKELRYLSDGLTDTDPTYLPLVPLEWARKILPAGTEIDPLTYTPALFWRLVIEDPEIPIFIEEGAKKALAAISAGQVAIALGGITCGFQRRSSRLRSMIRRLCCPDRKITIRFDAGKGEAERIHAERLARAINRDTKATARVCLWDGSLGKGTDDVADTIQDLYRELSDLDDSAIAALPDDLLQRCLARLRSAPQPPILLAQLSEANSFEPKPLDAPVRLTRSPDQIISGCFTGEAVIEGLLKTRLVALAGATGTSKTEAVVQVVEALRRQGCGVGMIAPTHRASLAGKYGPEFGIVRVRGSSVISTWPVVGPGVTCCCESATSPAALPRMLKELKNGDLPFAILQLDEVDQFLPYLLCGGTESLFASRGRALDHLLELMAHQKVMTIAADAAISDITLDLLEAIAGRRCHLISTTHQWPKDVELMGHGEALALAYNEIERDQPVWIALASLKEAALVGEEIRRRRPEARVLMVTGETSGDPSITAFMRDPDGQAESLDVVLHTQALTSGVSLIGERFQLVVVLQDHAIGPAEAVQMLNRCRKAPRRVLSLRRAVPNAAQTHRITAARGVGAHYAELMERAGKERFVGDLQALPPAVMGALTAYEARQSAEAFASESVLRRMLLAEGYRIVESASSASAGPRKAASTDGHKPSTLEEETGPGGFWPEYQILTGAMALEAHEDQVDTELEDGLPTDRINASLVEKIGLARMLHLDGLLMAPSYTASSPEVMAVWEALSTLEKEDRARLLRARFFSKGAQIPGCDRKGVLPPVAMATIGGLLRKVGAKQTSLSRCGPRGARVKCFKAEPNLNASR